MKDRLLNRLNLKHNGVYPFHDNLMHGYLVNYPARPLKPKLKLKKARSQRSRAQSLPGVNVSTKK